jgi:hypothetical protein
MLGVLHLKRLWSRMMARRGGASQFQGDDWQHDRIVIHTLGVGLEQTMQYVMRTGPSFEEFEQWIVETTGGVEPWRIERINAAIAGTAYPEEITRWLASVEAAEPVLDAEDLAFFDEHGYVVLHDAVPAESLTAAERAVWEYVGARPDDPDSWYGGAAPGIMLQYFQHPAFEANRRSPRIHKAFAQLYGTADLWTTTDRVGFSVPERDGRPFPGPDLHWDVSLALPIPFALQGILYLSDTPPEQGAFTLVPGFHRRIASWMADLPQGADPRNQDLHALGSMPVGGHAGDLIIWQQALPHGSRPNRGSMPRIVQYITMFPTGVEMRSAWI